MPSASAPHYTVINFQGDDVTRAGTQERRVEEERQWQTMLGMEFLYPRTEEEFSVIPGYVDAPVPSVMSSPTATHYTMVVPMGAGTEVRIIFSCETDGGLFLPYEASINNQLEAGYQRYLATNGMETAVNFYRAGASYAVDFATMQQIRTDGNSRFFRSISTAPSPCYDRVTILNEFYV
jgi:hypothetical protein